MEESQEQKRMKKRPNDPMVRRVCFTYNNYTPQGEAQILDLVKDDYFTYFLGGYEEAPTTGTPHIQGYCRLAKRKRFSTLKSMFPPGIHFEYAQGSTEDNIAYIKHNPTKPQFKIFFEYGNPKSDDTGGHAYEVKEWLEQGLTLNDLLSDSTYRVNSQTIKLYQTLSPLYTPKRLEKPEVIWVFGKPGAGKTKWVHDLEGDNLYNFQLDKKWFDGYNNHEALLWDDFDLDILTCTEDMSARDTLEQNRLLQRLFAICDRYEFRCNIKGSSTQLVVKRVYIIAHQPPWHLWKPTRNDYTLPVPDKPGQTYMVSASTSLKTPPAEIIETNSILSQMMRRITQIKQIELPAVKQLTYAQVEIIKTPSDDESNKDIADPLPVVNTDKKAKGISLFRKMN